MREWVQDEGHTRRVNVAVIERDKLRDKQGRLTEYALERGFVEHIRMGKYLVRMVKLSFGYSIEIHGSIGVEVYRKVAKDLGVARRLFTYAKGKTAGMVAREAMGL